MAITRISQSSVKEGLEKFPSFFGGLSGSFIGNYESIATITVGSGGASSITFSDIPGGFQHLQIRMLTGMQTASVGCFMNFNSDNASGKYKSHYLYGNGTSAAAGAAGTTTAGIAPEFGGGAVTTSPGGAIIDILDYASTTRNKVVRSFDGYDANGSGYVSVNSFVWLSTSAITSISIADAGAANFRQYTTAALYGLRAP